MKNLTILTALLFGLIVTGSAVAQDWLPSIPVGNIEIRLDHHAAGFTGNAGGVDQILPTKLVPIPDESGRMVVCTLGGLLRVIDGNGNILPNNSGVYLNTNTTETLTAPFAYGVTSVAFHPDFANAGQPGLGKFYVLATEGPKPINQYDFIPAFGSNNDHAAVLVEYTVDAQAIASNALITSGPNQNVNRRELFVAQEPDNEHNFCDLEFDANGLLYISAGDGAFNFNGGVNLESMNAPDLGTILGKVLRIDPLGNNSFNGNYGIVGDNVFAADANPATLDEIYSYGHRNPWRISIDFETESVVVGEVGHFNIEEVNLVTNGENYGWPDLEGTFLIDFGNGFNLMPDVGNAFANANNLLPPIFEFDHEDGRSVTGGFVYRGSRIPALQGKYIFGEFQGVDGFGTRLFFGDLVTGHFESLAITSGSENLGQPVSFGQDRDLELYVVTLDGRVLTINPIVFFGDVNLDGAVNLLDIQPFVALISNGGYQIEADINQDGAVNLLDVSPFINILSGS